MKERDIFHEKLLLIDKLAKKKIELLSNVEGKTDQIDRGILENRVIVEWIHSDNKDLREKLSE